MVTAHWRHWPKPYAYEYFEAIAKQLGGPDANLQSSFPRPYEIPITRRADVAYVEAMDAPKHPIRARVIAKARQADNQVCPTSESLSSSRSSTASEAKS